jgi:putative ABC transport system permease protein
MLLRILKNSFIKRPKAVFLVFLSIAMGAAVATAFLGIAGQLSHKMALELRSYGANILLEPAALEGGGFLREADLPKIKTVFWKYNITGFTPYLFGVSEFTAGGRRERGIISGTWFYKQLDVEGEEPSIQGIKIIAPWWDVQGNWPEAADEAIVGASLARRLKIAVGSEVDATAQGRTQRFRVSGIVTTGGYEEEQLFAPLVTVQNLLEKQGKVSRVLVSALTVPMDDFGKKKPATMTKEDYEKWYCTAYVTSGGQECGRGDGGQPCQTDLADCKCRRGAPKEAEQRYAAPDRVGAGSLGYGRFDQPDGLHGRAQPGNCPDEGCRR